MGAMEGQSDHPVVDLAAAADRLYGVDPGDFTTERKTMAAAVRSGGDKDLATLIDGLRAPTLAAWTLNQLVRAHPEQADALRRTGELLRAAQARLDADGLRTLRPQRDALLAAFLTAAATVAAARGQALSPAVQAEVRNTLVAALADERAQEAVLSGQLVKALLYAGLGEVALDADATPGPRVGSVAEAGTAEPAGRGIPGGDSSAAQAAPAEPETRAGRREAERRREQSEARRRREREAKERVRTADQALAAASLAEAQARQQVEAGQRRIAEFESLLESARTDQTTLEADAEVAAQERAEAAAVLDAARAALAALPAPQP